jgi:hypothetical protein
MILSQHAKFDPQAFSAGLQETNNPVFSALIDIMGKKTNWVILDLGPARTANLELLARFRCRLFIEDAHELITTFTGDLAADGAALSAWLAEWTVGTEHASLDVMLAWDIFNYLDPRLYTTFMDHVTPLLKPGAHLYFLIYSQRDMPALPMRFNLVAPNKMEYQPLSLETKPSPRFNQADLRKYMQDFLVVKSVLLRNGMQEYLLKRVT